MNLCDFEYLKNHLDTSAFLGSDACLANLFLLQEKYNTELKIHKNMLFRYYYGSENRTGYGFPLPIKTNDNKDTGPAPLTLPWLKNALEYIFADAKEENHPACFCLITQEEKKLIDDCLKQFFPDLKISWKTNRDDSDYLYLRQNLSDLPGSNYQKKRNHVSRFNRIYGKDWEFKPFPQNDLTRDILEVAEKWFIEKEGGSSEVLSLELKSIELALKNSELLQLTGGLLYIKGEPAAMTLAAPISADTLDVIYEKSFAEYEKNGAYAVINQQFARLSGSYLYINREEDMGVEGLRKAKLSYKPTIILDKFYGRIG